MKTLICNAHIVSPDVEIEGGSLLLENDRIIAEGIPDPVGTFYRFSLAGSLLRRSSKTTAGN